MSLVTTQLFEEGSVSEEMAVDAHRWFIEAAERAGIDLSDFDLHASVEERKRWALGNGLEIGTTYSRSREDVDTIVAALARLSADDRELVQLKIYARLTFREIAEATGRPLATVATRYRRAIDSLRPWLVKQYQE